MRKIKNSQMVVLLTTILLVSVFHACVKNEGEEPQTTDCKECYATKNGSQVGYQKVCSPSEETSFKNAHTDATVTCY